MHCYSLFQNALVFFPISLLVFCPISSISPRDDTKWSTRVDMSFNKSSNKSGKFCLIAFKMCVWLFVFVCVFMCVCDVFSPEKLFSKFYFIDPSKVCAATSENVPSEMHLANKQISLQISAVWSSSLDPFLITKGANFLHADNEDSGQTVQTCMLIWIFIICTYPKLHFLILQLVYVFSQ